MNDYLISLFIDDEMDIDEKIVFVETVHADRPFSLEAIALLEQEKQLLALPARMPKSIPVDVQIKPAFSWYLLFRSWLQPMAGFATALILVGLGFLLMPNQPHLLSQAEHRFVLYLPQAHQAKIVGTFTDWHPVPMQKIGSSGYWSLELKVPQGEHRYSYIVEDGNRIVDPTVAAREHDDFGGENSVIVVGGGDDNPVS
ncbi:MAG: glycogen-binding domain-containing protein [Pseudomonadota bacterium]